MVADGHKYIARQNLSRFQIALPVNKNAELKTGFDAFVLFPLTSIFKIARCKMKKGRLYSKRVKQRLAENISRFRFNWWRHQPARVRHFSVVFCLCDMCHQNRRSPPGLTPSVFDNWCDECYVDLPLWIKNEKTTVEELARLAKQKKDEAEKRRLEREEKARIQDARKRKKVKLTGFENVENEDKEETIKDVNRPVISGSDTNASIEEQRQKLESIFLYEDNDR
jgi:hypothetical protein